MKMRKAVSLIILFVLVVAIVQTRPVVAALTISPDTLPMAFVGSYYAAELRTDSKYPSYVKWEVMTGGPPPGLRFEAPSLGTAYIVGTPTSKGDYTFTVRATEQVPDGYYAEKAYTLQVRMTITPPSQTPMEFTCTTNPTKILLDPTEIASGRAASVLAPFTVSVRKTGGDLTEYVTITMSWFAVEPASAFTLIPDVTGGQPPIDKTIQVYVVPDRWRQVQGTTETLLITCKTPEKEQAVTVQVEVLSPQLVDLQLVSVQPITQRGPDLVKNKEAQFAFTYTKLGTGFEPGGDVKAWVEARLPKSQWDFTYHGGIYSATFESRDEGGFYIIRGQFSFRQTTIPPSPLELMFFPTDEGFFYPKPRTNVASLTMTIDPDNEIAEQNEDNNQILASWPVPYEASKLNLAWVYYRPEGLPWAIPPGKEGPWAFPRVARLYLPAIFPIKNLNVQPLLGDGINAWTAPTSYLSSNRLRLIKEGDQMAEVAAESGYHRVVAILPQGDLATLLEMPGVIGVVMPGIGSLQMSESYKVAYVNLNEATGSGTNYIPTVAHELSHTFGFPDIYDGCKEAPTVYYRWIYFDPVYGGIVHVGHPSDPDIMACGSSPQQWSDHSYQKVHDQLKTFGDPAEGLLISMIVYKNGTVDARPFQKLVDHPFPFPVAEGTGEYNLLLLGKDSGVIRSYPWNVDFSMLVDPGGKEPADSAPFVTVVEYFDDLGAVELRDANGNVLMRRDVSAHMPELTVIDPAPGKTLGRGLTYSFQWNCIDADGGDIWYSVLIRKSDQETWSNLAHYIKEKTLRFTVPGDAELGNYYLKFIATDGINTDMKIVSVSISTAAPSTVRPPQTVRTTTSSRSTTSPPGQGGFPDLTLLIIGILAVFVIIFAALALRTRKTGPSAPISVQPTPPAAAEKPGPLSLYCIDCGTENPSTNEFCGKCGRKLLRE
jgi:hypothetical protein